MVGVGAVVFGVGIATAGPMRSACPRQTLEIKFFGSHPVGSQAAVSKRKKMTTYSRCTGYVEGVGYVGLF